MLTDMIFTKEEVLLNLGVMSYAQTNGCLEAIKRNMYFAPKQGFLNNLSVGILPITSDGYIPLMRRADDSSHCAGYWNPSSGYMTSMHMKDETHPVDYFCHLKDKNLFDIDWQLNARIFKQEFKNLKKEEIEIIGAPNFLGFGWLTLEMCLSSVAKLKLDRKEAIEKIAEYQIEGKGTVEIADEGTYRIIEQSDKILRIQFYGEILQKTFSLSLTGKNLWQFKPIYAPDAG